MTEGSGVIAWAAGLLRADGALSGLGVHYRQAPQGSAFPHIILIRQSVVPVGSSIQGIVAGVALRLTAKAVTESSGYARAEAINGRIRSVLTNATGSAEGVDIASCTFQTEIDYVENREGGVRFNHLGSQFLVYCSEA